MDGMSTLHVGGIGMLHPEILATQKLLTVREAEELTGRKAGGSRQRSIGTLLSSDMHSWLP